MIGTPEKLYHISQTQLSIARYYGGCTFNGEEYIYDPLEDSLTLKKSLTKKQIREMEKKKWMGGVRETEERMEQQELI